MSVTVCYVVSSAALWLYQTIVSVAILAFGPEPTTEKGRNGRRMAGNTVVLAPFALLAIACARRYLVGVR